MDPQRTVAQYEHTRWTASDGAPAGISTIAQTPDGYLWVAGYDGLYRFDGITFERMDGHLGRAAVANDYPTGLFATRRGELWVYYHLSKRFAIYRDGTLRTIATPRPDGTVSDIAQTPNGDIWVAGGRIGQPMLRFHGGRWSKVQPSERHGRDRNMGMLVTADGALWVAYANNIFRWSPGSPRFQHMISDPGARMRLSLDPAGRVWVTGVGGSRPVTEPRGYWTGLPNRFRYPGDNFGRRGRPMFDRNGNLWVARRKDGLERHRTPSPLGPSGQAMKPDEFTARDGLSSDAAYTIFEDREGSIWVGTTLGLDRFRDADIVAEPALRETAAFGDILFADTRGNVFVGQKNTIYRVEPHGPPRPVLTGINEPEAICGGAGTSIWVVLADHIAVMDGDRRMRLAKPEGLESVIKDCGLDRWGRFWMSAEDDGLHLRTASGWKRVTPYGARRLRPGQMVHDRSGDLWLNGGPGALVRFDRSGPKIVKSEASRSLGEIRTLAAAGDGLLLLGTDAVAHLERGRASLVSDVQIGTLLGVNGAVRTGRGETWLFTRKGLTRSRTSDLERAFRDRRFRVPGRTFDFADGLIDSNSVRTPRALVEGGDGRLWAATASGTVWIDPARLSSNALPPEVAIRSIDFGGERRLDPRSLQLPAGTSDVTIGFAALSLRMPERVVVRYRLDGQDANWIDPGLRRQAYYTNLGPGAYRFHVIAANEDGVWNRTGASLNFTIAPTFLQSVWFKLLLAVLFVAILAAGYLFRLRQVTERLQSRFDVRIAERERIARELHDTLLQGFQGMLLQFKAVTNSLPADHQSRRLLDTALRRAQQVLIEARDRVKQLRKPATHADLANALLYRASTLVTGGRPRVLLTQEGSARALHPLVREELQRIAEEAVQNAVAHAQASTIEILLLWSGRDLRLAVRDDGVGMPASILGQRERVGHFGLIGMRERAERIGGTLEVTSREAAGTEVALVVPAHTAYDGHALRMIDRLSALWPSAEGARGLRGRLQGKPS